MTQLLDAKGPAPDCSAIKKRRQATQARGDVVGHHGVAQLVAWHTVSREIGAATGCRIRVGASGSCTKTSPIALIRAAALTLRDVIRRFATAQRRRRLSRATVLTLQSLDSHTLRDLGFDRSEIPSAVAELIGEVDITRARFVQSL